MNRLKLQVLTEVGQNTVRKYNSCNSAAKSPLINYQVLLSTDKSWARLYMNFHGALIYSFYLNVVESLAKWPGIQM